MTPSLPLKAVLALCALFLLPIFAATAADKPGPTEVAQSFYDAYMKVLLANGDTEKFVLSSKELSQSFKKAYSKLVADGMESDPIICGQDYPDAGFVADPAKISGAKASVAMKSRDDEFKHSFKVTLRLVDGQWLISDTNDLKAEADD